MPKASLRTLDELPDVREKRVLVRVDFNVPVDDAGGVSDDTRIRAALPTIEELSRRGARVILMSHRGRPKKWGDASLDVAARTLEKVWGHPVAFTDDIVGERARKAVAGLKPGEVLLLENLRYAPGEKSGDREFAQRLASLADLYVDDAFGTAHRDDASVALVPEILPGFAGRLLMRELDYLLPLTEKPHRPYWAVIGGAKVGDKLGILGALLDQVDGMAVGGGMANTFLAAQGREMGASRIESDRIGSAREILQKAKERGIPLWLPDRVVAARDFSRDASARVVEVGCLESDEMALDVAVEAVQSLWQQLADAKTIFWNGPLGVFEWPRFAEGTLTLARHLADASARVIVGGGDSVAAVTQAGLADKFFHVSTGGGAALQLLEGKPLSGVEALKRSPRELT